MNSTAAPPSLLPKPETMLTYASILEKPQYWIDPKNGQKYLLATGEIIEAACAALRFCAATPASEETDLVSGYVYRESYRLGTEWRRRAEEAEAREPVDITGWKLVPDVPTEEMWQAGRSADIHPGDSYTKVWSAMFEAAPDVDDCETTVSRPLHSPTENKGE